MATSPPMTSSVDVAEIDKNMVSDILEKRSRESLILADYLESILGFLISFFSKINILKNTAAQIHPLSYLLLPRDWRGASKEHDSVIGATCFGCGVGGIPDYAPISVRFSNPFGTSDAPPVFAISGATSFFSELCLPPST